MNREEAIRAMLDGKKVKAVEWSSNEYCYVDHTERYPFQYFCEDYSEPMEESWEYHEWELLPEQKKRPMTREEILGFLANTSGVVVRIDESRWMISHTFTFDSRITNYEYAYIDKKGNIGEPMKFEVEE